MSDLDAYNYSLPDELIAQSPAPKRVDARLLVINRSDQSITHAHIRDLPELLAPNDCLVLNDTRVIPARLVGNRTKTGGRWEGLFLNFDENGFWQIMGKTRGKLIAGETITLQRTDGTEDVKLLLATKLEGGIWVAKPQTDEPPLELLDRVGRVPLPPYIRGGDMVETDRTRYQTVFARTPGAVAAPTAGLHFTEGLLEKIKAAGVTLSRITLHVGLGTFRPISVDRFEEHEMHSEWGQISQATIDQIDQCRGAGGRVVAVGTTSVRLLESAATPDGVIHPFADHTDLFIRPPYQFRAVDTMLTNFHLPMTTLLVLVRTFGGDELIRRAYQEAIEQRYRFYSYGDAMLIL
jgi:S-adenosylmethionine:tRNA ribosyltransferase-isomerase